MRELFRLSVRELAAISGERLPDSGLVITGASTLNAPRPNSIVFVKSISPESQDYLVDLHDALVLVPAQGGTDLPRSLQTRNVIAVVSNPRLAFANIMNAVLDYVAEETVFQDRNGAWIAAGIDVPASVRIEPGVLIDRRVEIAEDVQILSGARIRSYTRLGRGAIVRENAVVGSQGFGFERDDRGVPFRLPHVGGVVIGRGAEIGASSTVCAGTIEPSIIGDFVKISNLVHIAHNCDIGQASMIAACVELSGSVKVGKMTWIGPNCSVIEGRAIGNNAIIGLGAVVLKDIPDGSVVAGNPARSTAELSRLNAALRQLMGSLNS